MAALPVQAACCSPESKIIDMLYRHQTGVERRNFELESC